MFDPFSLPSWPQKWNPSEKKSGGLVWRPPNLPSERTNDQKQTREDSSKLKNFSRTLLKGDFMDTKAVELPGANVVLPRGVTFLKLFYNLVEGIYEKYGLKEYHYPLLLPCNVIEPTGDLFSIENRILKVGTDKNFLEGNPIGILAPTGESVIYSHWRKQIKTRDDLPVEMFRKAYYFRPQSTKTGSGSAIFRAMESRDIYEFHCCYVDQKSAYQAFPRFLKMLNEISASLALPVLWSIRPRWTNNSAVARATLAADLVLPIGKTIQVAAIYDQAEAFSQVYGIQTSDHSQRLYTYHLAGFCSRRMPLGHLLWSMKEDGYLAINPQWAPEQLALILKYPKDQYLQEAESLKQLLLKQGIRMIVIAGGQGRKLSTARRSCAERGIPIDIVVHQLLDESGFRCVITRSDTGEEADLKLTQLQELTSFIPTLLAEISHDWCKRVFGAAAAQIVEVFSIDAVREVVKNGKIAVCPLLQEEAPIRTLEMGISGEVLGFVYASENLLCVQTGRDVATRGLVSRRL